jgi:23S rRNA pseudouridine2457 synthase
MLIAFNKPYGVLSQFTKEHESHRTLAEFNFPANVYSIGRLDSDSEGLLLLSDEAQWNGKLLHPRNAHRRTYHAQVEGVPTAAALLKLSSGVKLSDFTTLPCKALIPLPAPQHTPRVPPIRVRKTVPDTWLELTLIEGKNRQVRRMTAAVGFPTLRLIRVAMGDLNLASLKLESGQWRQLGEDETKLIMRR